jgi:YjbR
VTSATSRSSFDRLAEGLLEEPGTEEGAAFHQPGLKVGGKIFAMLVEERLVVKLPAHRCAELVESGGCERFVIGTRTMREWVTVPHAAEDRWPELAREALAFVGGR